MIGTSLGPYCIDAELGSGGMGTVYAGTVEGRAPGIDLGSRVALKVVHPHLLGTPGFFKRFLREAEIGKTVRHENVVRTFDADSLKHDGDQVHFLVMELIEGQTLAALIEEIGRAPEELCRHVGREVAKGLAAIHEAGVVHRDLKPENVLITPDHVVKIMDLGVARLADEAIRLSQSGAFVGSVHYAAPEQFRSSKHVDARTDLHALGALLYELASGHPPFAGDDFRTVMRQILNDAPRRLGEANPQVSAFFEEAVHRLLDKDREERFASAAEVHDLLEAGEASDWWRARARDLTEEIRRPLRRIHVPRETAVHGRDDDIARLREVYDRGGGVVLLEGEAGIGKTRLVDEFVARLRADGESVHFLFGSYPPSGAATAAGAFSSAYREHFGAEGLEEKLREILTVTPLLVPSFAALLRGGATPEGAEPLTKDSLQTVFVHTTRALAADRPTVVVIDDLHFAPEDGRALFASLALAVPGHRIVLIGTYRRLPEDFTAGLDRLEHTTHIPLKRLGPKDLGGLLRDAFHSEQLAEELGWRIAQKSDGNPFFVFEILRGLREGQFITRGDDGTWATTNVIDEIQIPSSVLELIQARVADLDEADRDLLDVAACCGFEFDPLLVGEVVGLGRIPVLKRLAQIERRHRLVRAVGVTYVFDHHQVQEALYETLSELLRREYHGALGESLERRAGDDLGGELVVELAEHYLRGARGQAALPHLESALDHLEAGYLNDSAIALADRALTIPDLLTGEQRVDLLIRKAGRLALLGRYDEEARAIQDARNASADATQPARAGARVAAAEGAHLVRGGRYEESVTVLRGCLAAAQDAGDRRVLARAINTLGTAYLRLAHYDDAAVQFEAAQKETVEQQDGRAEGRAHGNLGTLRWLQGRFDEAKQYFRQALDAARAAGDRQAEASVVGNLGAIALARGERDEGHACMTRQVEISREIGDRVGEGNGTRNLGALFLAQGRFDEGRRMIERGLAIGREMGLGAGEVLGRCILGEILSMCGDADRAAGKLARAAAEATRIGAQRELAYARYFLARNLARRGDIAGSRTDMEVALEMFRDIGESIGETSALVEWCAIEQRGGTSERALELGTEGLELALAAGLREQALMARAHLAALPGGDVPAALESLAQDESTLELANAMGAHFALWEATGDRAHLASAREKLLFLRDHAPEEYRETILTNVPLHAEIVAGWAQRGSDPA